MKIKVLKTTLYSYLVIMFITILLNVLTSRDYPWSLYPGIVLLFVPLTVYFIGNWNNLKGSLCYMGLLLLLVVTVNLVNTPETIWFHHVLFFLVWWPLFAILGNKSKSLLFAAIGSLAIIGFAFFEYEMYSPDVTPWHYHIIVPALCWPTGNIIARKSSISKAIKASVLLTVFSAGVIAIMFLVLNLY